MRWQGCATLKGHEFTSMSKFRAYYFPHAVEKEHNPESPPVILPRPGV